MPDAVPKTVAASLSESGPIEPGAFRALMGQFPTGVCVVTVASEGKSGAPIGITVNSLVSVSLDPMLVSWSIQNRSSQFEAYTQADQFSISILAEGQQDIAGRYARRGSNDFIEEDFWHSTGGLPVIANALGYLECRRWSLYPAGDHTVIFGEVVGIKSAANLAPLGFFGGEFCRIAD